MTISNRAKVYNWKWITLLTFLSLNQSVNQSASESVSWTVK